MASILSPVISKPNVNAVFRNLAVTLLSTSKPYPGLVIPIPTLPVF